MSAGKLHIVRALGNPKKKKNRKRMLKRKSPRRKLKNSSAREMIMSCVSHPGTMDTHDWWTGTSWSRQKAKGKKYRWREDLNKDFSIASKKPPTGAYMVVTVPA